MNSEEKTLFQEESEKYQENQGRTKKARVSQGLTIAGVSLVTSLCFWLLLLFLDFKVSPLISWAVPLLFIGLAGGFLYGIGKVVVSALRSTKAVTCPSCGVENQVFPDVRKFMCTQCSTLMLMGDDIGKMPQLSACSYCNLQTAVSADYGTFICSNCGLVRESTRPELPVNTRSCPECNQAVPEGGIFCKSCGCILQDNFTQPAQGNPALAYDQDWKIGKDAIGHFYFSKALLKGIGKNMGKVRDLVRVQVLFSDLADALKSLEEAWLVSSLRAYVEPLLPEVDLVYTALLERELALVKSLPGKFVFAKDSLDTIAKEPHIAARKRLEPRLGPAIESTGCIGKWSEKLVVVGIKENNSAIKDYNRLALETARFRDWVSSRSNYPEKSVCPQCGRVVKSAQKFCNNCGSKL